jgi:hypothetical protein
MNLNYNIKNTIITLYHKNKFNNVVKQIRRVPHEFREYEDYYSHTIIFRKKNYDIKFLYTKGYSTKIIMRVKSIIRVNSGRRKVEEHICYDIDTDISEDTPRIHIWELTCDLEDCCRYDMEDTDINYHKIKEIERDVINYYNTLKPMKRIIKIKKSK